VFLDCATIEVYAGDGGDGVISFRREAHVPRGGPDGGDGGLGGSIILEASRHLNSLDRIARNPVYRAEPGVAGSRKKCAGRTGKSVIIKVPEGTRILRKGRELVDLVKDGQSFVLAQGGKGGKGNARFATATRQVPRIATRGEPGKEGKFQLELKLIAQVGLVGLPNAGKSTFLRATTEAKPAVASYPFTTLAPYLGVAELSPGHELILADIPGLIEGASKGVGLGDDFLRHVERTGLLLHLVDATGGADNGTPEPLEAYRIIRKELVAHGAGLADKRVVVALNKRDAMAQDEAEELRADFETELGERVHLISGVTRQGVKDLLYALAKLVDEEALETEAKAHAAAEADAAAAAEADAAAEA